MRNVTELIYHPSWRSCPPNEWRWANFTPEEMACRKSGELKISTRFMERLQSLRDMCGPLTISSGYRSQLHDDAIGGSGAHCTGMAADIRCYGDKAHLVVCHALQLFPRIGVQQNGALESRFVHVDLIDDGSRPSPWIWSY